ncbi:MAG: hypothetical protein GY845_33960 [Planctomycetes bacterium]|nr:hypothetical protein [Planctomycetota bacterium]
MTDIGICESRAARLFLSAAPGASVLKSDIHTGIGMGAGWFVTGGNRPALSPDWDNCAAGAASVPYIPGFLGEFGVPGPVYRGWKPLLLCCRRIELTMRFREDTPN